MKFDIFKIFLALCAITICLQVVSSLHSKSRLGTKMNLGIKSGMRTGSNMKMKSNYKFSLKNLVTKSHKKTENNSSAKSNNRLSELNKMNSKILFRGWMKYFKFPDDETQRKPKNFFKNPLFEKDSKRKHAVGEVNKLNKTKNF